MSFNAYVERHSSMVEGRFARFVFGQWLGLNNFFLIIIYFSFIGYLILIL